MKNIFDIVYNLWIEFEQEADVYFYIQNPEKIDNYLDEIDFDFLQVKDSKSQYTIKRLFIERFDKILEV